ncbi:MAG: anti-sigma factor [Candidatus Velthaea sp.]
MSGDETAHELLEAYALGALDAPERVRFERHLAACSRCRREREAYAGVFTALEALPIPEPPGPPRVPVARTIATPKKRPLYPRFALAAAAAAVLVTSVAVPRYERYRAQHDAYAEIARMLATDPVEVALVGEGGVSGRAIVGEGHRASGFVVRGLAPAPAGLVYRVWVREATRRRSPGVLDVTPDGLQVLVTPGDAFVHASSIRVMLERERAPEGAPRRMMLEGTLD